MTLNPQSYQFVSLNTALYPPSGGGDGSDISFVESVSCNADWDIKRGDGKAMVYFPISLTDGQLSIRAFDVKAIKPVSSLVANVSLGSDGPPSLSCYGSKLNSDGMMWICVFNANAIICVDLNAKRMTQKILDIPCPNDLCFDPNDPNTIYVAGGDGVSTPFESGSGSIAAALPVVGKVYKIDIAKRESKVILEGHSLHALAGIGCSQAVVKHFSRKSSESRRFMKII